MAGEIDLELNGLFAADETVILTRTRLNQLLTGLAARIAANAVTAREIADGSISPAKLAQDVSAIIADASVTTAKLADESVTTAKLGANSVRTAKILDANVTTAKIADANVTTAKITDANVTTAKIADANVTTAKIADANVTLAKLATAVFPQVQMVQTRGAQTITGSNQDVSDLTITCTPRSAASRFLLISQLTANATYGATAFYSQLSYGSTEVAATFQTLQDAWGASVLNIFLHSPATASAVTYKVSASKGAANVDLISGQGRFLVFEII